MALSQLFDYHCARLLSLNKRFRIVAGDEASAAIENEINRFRNILCGYTSEPSDIESHSIGFLITVRALMRLQEDGRYFLFRQASRQECKEAHVSRYIKDDKGNYLCYCFYEPPGYRFTLLLNLGSRAGSIIDMKRITDGYGNPVLCLRYAHLRIDSFSEDFY